MPKQHNGTFRIITIIVGLCLAATGVIFGYGVLCNRVETIEKDAAKINVQVPVNTLTLAEVKKDIGSLQKDVDVLDSKMDQSRAAQEQIKISQVEIQITQTQIVRTQEEILRKLP